MTKGYVGRLRAFCAGRDVKDAIKEESQRLWDAAEPKGLYAIIGYDELLMQVRVFVTDEGIEAVRDEDGRLSATGGFLSADPVQDALDAVAGWEK